MDCFIKGRLTTESGQHYEVKTNNAAPTRLFQMLLEVSGFGNRSDSIPEKYTVEIYPTHETNFDE